MGPAARCVQCCVNKKGVDLRPRRPPTPTMPTSGPARRSGDPLPQGLESDTQIQRADPGESEGINLLHRTRRLISQTRGLVWREREATQGATNQREAERLPQPTVGSAEHQVGIGGVGTPPQRQRLESADRQEPVAPQAAPSRASRSGLAATRVDPGVGILRKLTPFLRHGTTQPGQESPGTSSFLVSHPPKPAISRPMTNRSNQPLRGAEEGQPPAPKPEDRQPGHRLLAVPESGNGNRQLQAAFRQPEEGIASSPTPLDLGVGILRKLAPFLRHGTTQTGQESPGTSSAPFSHPPKPTISRPITHRTNRLLRDSEEGRPPAPKPEDRQQGPSLLAVPESGNGNRQLQAASRQPEEGIASSPTHLDPGVGILRKLTPFLRHGTIQPGQAPPGTSSALVSHPPKPTISRPMTNRSNQLLRDSEEGRRPAPKPEDRQQGPSLLAVPESGSRNRQLQAASRQPEEGIASSPTPSGVAGRPATPSSGSGQRSKVPSTEGLEVPTQLARVEATKEGGANILQRASRLVAQTKGMVWRERNMPQGATNQGQPQNFPQGGTNLGQPQNFPQGGTNQGQPQNFPQGGTNQRQPQNFPQGGTNQRQAQNFPPGGTNQRQAQNFPPGGTNQGQAQNFPPGGTNQGRPQNFPQTASRTDRRELAPRASAPSLQPPRQELLPAVKRQAGTPSGIAPRTSEPMPTALSLRRAVGILRKPAGFPRRASRNPEEVSPGPALGSFHRFHESNISRQMTNGANRLPSSPKEQRSTRCQPEDRQRDSSLESLLDAQGSEGGNRQLGPVFRHREESRPSAQTLPDPTGSPATAISRPVRVIGGPSTEGLRSAAQVGTADVGGGERPAFSNGPAKWFPGPRVWCGGKEMHPRVPQFRRKARDCLSHLPE